MYCQEFCLLCLSPTSTNNPTVHHFGMTNTNNNQTICQVPLRHVIALFRCRPLLPFLHSYALSNMLSGVSPTVRPAEGNASSIHHCSSPAVCCWALTCSERSAAVTAVTANAILETAAVMAVTVLPLQLLLISCCCNCCSTTNIVTLLILLRPLQGMPIILLGMLHGMLGMLLWTLLRSLLRTLLQTLLPRMLLPMLLRMLLQRRPAQNPAATLHCCCPWFLAVVILVQLAAFPRCFSSFICHLCSTTAAVPSAMLPFSHCRGRHFTVDASTTVVVNCCSPVISCWASTTAVHVSTYDRSPGLMWYSCYHSTPDTAALLPTASRCWRCSTADAVPPMPQFYRCSWSCSSCCTSPTALKPPSTNAVPLILSFYQFCYSIEAAILPLSPVLLPALFSSLRCSPPPYPVLLHPTLFSSTLPRSPPPYPGLLHPTLFSSTLPCSTTCAAADVSRCCSPRVSLLPFDCSCYRLMLLLYHSRCSWLPPFFFYCGRFQCCWHHSFRFS